jgi:predicted CopG family antitoxin
MHTFINMVRTITIKDEVYQELLKIKGAGESFSDVIMGLLKRRKVDLSAFFGVFKNVHVWIEIEKELLKDRRRAVLR